MGKVDSIFSAAGAMESGICLGVLKNSQYGGGRPTKRFDLQQCDQATSTGDRLLRSLLAVGSAHAVDPALNRVLAEELPRLGRLDWKSEAGRRGRGLVQAFLDLHRGEIREDLDDTAASFLIATLVESALNSSYRQGKYAPGRNALLRELADMIHRYVAK